MTKRHYWLPLLSIVFCGCGEQQEQAPPELTRVQLLQADEKELMRGQALFQGSCATFCHDLDYNPDNDASFLFDCEWKHGSSDEQIVRVIREGVPGTRMVAYGDNFPEEDDPWRIVAWLRDQSPNCQPD
jgi:mono/diheme cytochrome c family protein